jgi:hypothetical protein
LVSCMKFKVQVPISTPFLKVFEAHFQGSTIVLA